MLIGKIKSIVVQTGNQINLEVLYEDKDTGFSRTNIFTIPSSEVTRLSDSTELENYIKAQGQEYKIVQEKKSDFDAFINQEFKI